MQRTVSRTSLWLAAFAAGVALAQAPDPVQLERRISSVETLIERSSGARQIETSGVPAALEKRELARAKHREAAAAYKAGDYAKTAALLPQAASQMVEAVRLAAPEQVTSGKKQSDFSSRLESARALAAAQRRIAAEKNVPGGAETTKSIDALLGQAEGEAAAGRYDTASAALEQGYLLAKASIGSMRGGDTLVRSLNFASPKEEYAYEVDRNDTHRMLLNVLLDTTKTDRAAPVVARAAELRQQAESQARVSDYPAAIKLLEESTRELVKAIRAAGVYIPG
jgi:hypothetical protein